MAKYRKKPIVIDAVQWTGTNQDEVIEFLGSHLGSVVPNGEIVVQSMEGNVRGPVGMWVMRGVQGEHYLCAPDIFAATYDVVDDAVPA